MNNALAYLLAIGWSPFFLGHLGLSPLLTYTPVLLMLGGWLLIRKKIKMASIYLPLVILIWAGIGAIFTQSRDYFIQFAFLPISIFVCINFIANHKNGVWQVALNLSNLMLLGLIGGWIGFFYAFFGGAPILEFQNPDGRINQLFLTTFSNTQIGNIIRPSFIYDEPGAFSFVICFTVAVREMLGLPRAKSIVLMLGGLITFSLTHIIILILYFLWINARLFLVAIASMAIIASSLIENESFDFFFDRFQIIDGKPAGDNRTNQFENFMNVADLRLVMLGNYKCHSRDNKLCPEHGDISSSPVTPLYLGGALLLIVQIAVHFFLLKVIIESSRHRMTAIIISLLILQRPFFISYGYQLMIIFVTAWLIMQAKPGVSNSRVAAAASSIKPSRL